MKISDRDRIRNKQDKLLSREIPRALRLGLNPGNIKLSSNITNRPALTDLRKFVYPEYEATIDELLDRKFR